MYASLVKRDIHAASAANERQKHGQTNPKKCLLVGQTLWKRCVKVAVTSFQLKIRLHAHPVGTNT